MPSTTCKTFLPGKFIPTHCIRRQLFSTLFGITIVPARGLFIVLSITLVLVSKEWAKNVVVTTISSGRMSSQHILREDELEGILLFSPLPWCLSPHILREDELDTYPQGG